MNQLIRQPFAILGAFAFISLLGELVTLQETLADIIHALRAVTRPLWGFLFSWLPFKLPNIVRDYMTVGTIITGMTVRMHLFRWNLLQKEKIDKKSFRFLTFRFGKLHKGQWFRFYFLDLPLRIIDNFLFWPIVFTVTLLHYAKMYRHEWESEENKRLWIKGYEIYFETFLWSLLILAANYALIFGW